LRVLRPARSTAEMCTNGRVVRPIHAPTDRDFLKLSGSSIAVVKEVAVIVPMPRETGWRLQRKKPDQSALAREPVRLEFILGR
jgi:hypothetical protein